MENSNVPEVAIFTIIHVLFNSPESKQPELADAGFIDGLETVPETNSVTKPEPLGST
jgi:hypothetical protein